MWLSLENIKPSPFENEQPMKSSRYCSTELQQTKSFNDFIYFNLSKGVLKRFRNKDMNSSSWHFNHFLYVKILDTGNQFFQ